MISYTLYELANHCDCWLTSCLKEVDYCGETIAVAKHQYRLYIGFIYSKDVETKRFNAIDQVVVGDYRDGKWKRLASHSVAPFVEDATTDDADVKAAKIAAWLVSVIKTQK